MSHLVADDTPNEYDYFARGIIVGAVVMAIVILLLQHGSFYI